MLKKTLVLAVGSVLAASQAFADPLAFDFNNAAFNGGTSQVVSVGSWDWTQTSFVAQNGNTAILNFANQGNDPNACDNGGCDFTVYTHAALTGVKDSDGNEVDIQGLGTGFEITVELAFDETVTGLIGNPGGSGTIATFAGNPDGGYVNVYYQNSASNTNDVQGFGFNDGLVILEGDVLSDTAGNFTITEDDPVQLDQFPNNNAASDDYGDGSGTVGQSQLTITGFGIQQELSYGNLSQDFDYFTNQLQDFGISFASISIGLPVTSVDPSDCFGTTAQALGTNVALGAGECAAVHTDGLYSAQAADPNGGYLPVTNNVNGAAVPGDFVAMTDFNSSFDAVPEPASLALLSLGLVGFGASRSVRFRKKI